VLPFAQHTVLANTRNDKVLIPWHLTRETLDIKLTKDRVLLAYKVVLLNNQPSQEVLPQHLQI